MNEIFLLYTVHAELHCDFTDGLCDFTQKKSETLTWKEMKGESRQDEDKPRYDHTNKTGQYVNII